MISEQFLQNVVSENDRLAIRQILEEFNQEKQKGSNEANREVLDKLSSKAIEYEMRYLPFLHKDVLKKLPAEKRALLILVGNQKNPILITLSIIQPHFVVFIHTKESKETVQKILDHHSSFPQPKFETLQIDPLIIPQTYNHLANLVKKYEKEKFNWICDITAGKKVMGASLAAFGFWRRIPVLYLESQEFAKTTVPFSERLYLIDNPYDCYGDPLLEMAQKALQRFDFDSAKDALASLLETTSLQLQYHKTELALEVVNLYYQWDHFGHSDPDEQKAKAFFDSFKKTLNTVLRLDHRFIDPEQAEKNVQFLDNLNETYQAQKVSLADPYRLADIFQNAQRRAVQMNFDDAVARLYRCVEMAATWVLAQLDPDFNPDKGDWEKLKQKYPDIEQSYREKAKKALPNDKNDGLPKSNKIGLGAQITLAAALAECISSKVDLNDPKRTAVTSAKKIFEIYCKHNDHDGPFAQRNRSILAHGTRAVSESVFKKFNSVAYEICQLAVGKECWANISKMAKFPVFHLVD